jgi:hypothetical protein
MAEATVSLSYTDIVEEVAYQLGYTQDGYGNYGTDQQTHIDRIIQRGYRRFLNPPPLPGQAAEAGHRWRFLRPTTTLVTERVSGTDGVTSSSVLTSATADDWTTHGCEAGDSAVLSVGTGTLTAASYTVSSVSTTNMTLSTDPGDDTTVTYSIRSGDGDFYMPDDFGGTLLHPFMFDTDTTGTRLARTDVANILRHRQGDDQTTGKPRLFAIRPRRGTPTGASTGQRYEAMFWPVPDDAYTLYFSYQVLVSKLDSTNVYPVGGAEHCETVLASCLAMVEMETEGQQGVAYQNFLQQLAASIAVDMEMSTANLGHNTDGSDIPWVDQIRALTGVDNTITYNSTEYE